jgi:hypothetical protein
MNHAQRGDPMRIDTCCGSCTRELLLGQLVQPSDGFRCPVSGFAFAPAYASAARTLAAGVAAQADPVTTSPGLVDDWRREAVLEAGSYQPGA